ncbi:hypothetical protein PHG31p23 [Aeromonas phage 31]|uniref:Uncharacterized protein PHG31ORF024c n=1 Tax=Aeromonas phage 31 TaxID=321023 RepID=Q56EY8_9CAUD|nr:hypothetical protein PHG31p23 [Aeromonas phage 31]AAX63512.1 hypothetical protein PHG31p23 [Aeromonas phage 31]APU00918.1 hypothetical protein [Aeromonas phage 31.2]
MWKELDRDSQVVTSAMNTPGGVIIRIAHTFDVSNVKIQFIAGVKVVKDANYNGFELVHG